MIGKIRKIMMPLWLCLSSCFCSLFLFQFQDEILFRREMLCVFLAVLFSGAAAFFITRRIRDSFRRIALLISMLFSLCLCLWLEREHPLIIVPTPEPTVLEIRSEPDSAVSFTWAYWSRPDREVNDELNDWHYISDIRSDKLELSGEWIRENDVNICSGECAVGLKPGIRFSRPVFCFEGSGTVSVIRPDSAQYTVSPESALRFFLSDSGFSRQLVFLVLFLCVWGIAYLPVGGVLCLFRTDSPEVPEIGGRIIYPAAFLLPVIIVVGICYLLKMWPFGEKTFLITDMQVQYADYLIYLRQILRGERSLFYAFGKSIGDDFLSLYAYYLGNPLNWITALFPVRNFPAAIGIIVIARYGLCGLTSAVWFRKSFRSGGETLIFSTAYALISLQFVIGEHIQLRDGAILLPLILLGIDRMIRQSRSGLYIASLAAALLISYYSAYQICFFCVLYFLFRVLMENAWSGRQLVRFAAASLMSAALCAVFLIPVAVQLTKGMKTFDPSKFTFSLNMRFPELAGKLFSSAFDQGQTLTSGFPNIFCGLLVTTGLPLFFMNRRISGKEKLLSGGVLALCAAVMEIKALDLILHGFTEPVWWPYRYSFIVCLFMILVSLRCYQEREGISAGAVCVSAVIIFGLLFLVRGQAFSWFTEDAFLLNLLLCGCMLLLWLCAAVSGPRFCSVIVILTAVDLLLNGWMILADKTAYLRSEAVPDFQQFFDANLPAAEALREYDGEFYRTEKTYSRDANDAMTLGYYGIGHYSSTLNYSLMQFLPKMGYRYYPWRFLYAEGSDLAADSLFGIRYLISDQPESGKPYEEAFSFGDYRIYRNPYSLPIAFFGEENDVNPESSVFELQNEIFQTLTGGKDPIYTRVMPEETVPDPLPNAPVGENGEDGMTLHFPVREEAGLYLYIRDDVGEALPIDVYADGEFLTEYFDGRGIPIIPIPAADGRTSLTLTLKPKSDRICFDEILVYSEDTGVLEKYADMLRKSTHSLSKDSETSLSGEISADGDGYLFFSIPYDKGWSVMIDGKPAVPEPAFDVFLSVPVTKGDHSFAIRYLPEGLKTGGAVTSAAVLLLVLIGIRKKKTGIQVP